MTTGKKNVAKKSAVNSRNSGPKKDHPDQAIDTDLPDGETVDEDAFKALQESYEGDPDD